MAAQFLLRISLARRPETWTLCESHLVYARVYRAQGTAQNARSGTAIKRVLSFASGTAQKPGAALRAHRMPDHNNVNGTSSEARHFGEVEIVRLDRGHYHVD